MRFHWLLLFLALFIFPFQNLFADKPVAPEQVHGASQLNAEQLIELAQNKPDLLLIDARRPSEFKTGHIQGAVNLLDVDLTEDKLLEIANSKSRPILFYCNGARCLRSSNAAKMALEWGFENIYWFRGGWQEWSSKGYPISY
jgi:rhodanese-related sulfurtransferase